VGPEEGYAECLPALAPLVWRMLVHVAQAAPRMRDRAHKGQTHCAPTRADGEATLRKVLTRGGAALAALPDNVRRWGAGGGKNSAPKVADFGLLAVDFPMPAEAAPPSRLEDKAPPDCVEDPFGGLSQESVAVLRAITEYLDQRLSASGLLVNQKKDIAHRA
jgi:hypothetical protein